MSSELVNVQVLEGMRTGPALQSLLLKIPKKRHTVELGVFLLYPWPSPVALILDHSWAALQ